MWFVRVNTKKGAVTATKVVGEVWDPESEAFLNNMLTSHRWRRRPLVWRRYCDAHITMSQFDDLTRKRLFKAIRLKYAEVLKERRLQRRGY